MYDSAIIYAALFIGFILLILVIRFLPFSKKQQDSPALMYYKIELKIRTVTAIAYPVLVEDTKKLSNNDYELIFLSDLESLIHQKAALPEKSFLIGTNETYCDTLKDALPVLIKENISLVIFLPVLISPNSKKFHQKEVQQINEFLFSGEFKNIFSYTQPNC